MADAYDTLTSDRPYRRAVNPFEAKQMIVSGAGASFDPTVVDALVSRLRTRADENTRDPCDMSDALTVG